MMQADALHREAALLSNRLADFADDDVDGRKPIVQEILSIREKWKDVRYLIATGQPRREEKPVKPTEPSLGLPEADLKKELQRIRVNVSKYEGKIAENPDHKKRDDWERELARLKALRQSYEIELVRLKYETK